MGYLCKKRKRMVLLQNLKNSQVNIKNEVLSGLTVALALVPEAVAFSLIANVSPLVGLYSAFIIGLITSIFGGRPGMISGATGAIAVVIVALVKDHSVAFLFPAVVLMGIFQMLVGVFKLGKFIRLVPHAVMFGFVNGLAIVIFLAQLVNFKDKVEPDHINTATSIEAQETPQEGNAFYTYYPTTGKEETSTCQECQQEVSKDASPCQTCGQISSFEKAEDKYAWKTGKDLWIMIILAVFTMLTIHFLPKLTKAVPSALVAIVIVSLVVIFFGIDTKTVSDIASIKGGLPKLHLPGEAFSFTWENFMIILPYSIIMALVGLVESLLTLSVVDELTETRGRGNKESFAQGVANVVCGAFGGMGGCAMIGQSVINVTSGGRQRLSGIVAAVGLLVIVLFGSSLIEKIPMAAMAGLMFMVAIGTFEWASLKMFRNMPITDVIVMVTVAAVTVIFHNLAVAVFIGIIISSLAFAWNHATNIHARPHINKEGRKVYEVDGPLFFGSTAAFLERFDVANDPDGVIIDFQKSKVWDHSAIEALNKLTERYSKNGKKVHLRHLSQDCRTLFDNASAIIEVNILDDPKYKVVSDKLA